MDSLTPFRLGDWRVDPVANTFELRDETTSVEPKAMQVLEALAEQPGELVSKSELLERVWPGRFVTDDVLTGAIGQLRRALGDDARSPAYIQTVPRRGYRLIAEVA
ncbi:MAG: transcriptional regulator, partial [Acidobacteriota bacterium]